MGSIKNKGFILNPHLTKMKSKEEVINVCIKNSDKKILKDYTDRIGISMAAFLRSCALKEIHESGGISV